MDWATRARQAHTVVLEGRGYLKGASHRAVKKLRLGTRWGSLDIPQSLPFLWDLCPNIPRSCRSVGSFVGSRAHPTPYPSPYSDHFRSRIPQTSHNRPTNGLLQLSNDCRSLLEERLYVSIAAIFPRIPHDPAEADSEHFWICCTAGILGERLYFVTVAVRDFRKNGCSWAVSSFCQKLETPQSSQSLSGPIKRRRAPLFQAWTLHFLAQRRYSQYPVICAPVIWHPAI